MLTFKKHKEMFLFLNNKLENLFITPGSLTSFRTHLSLGLHSEE